MFTVIKWLCFYYMSLSGNTLLQGVTEHKGVWEYWILNRSFSYIDTYSPLGVFTSHSESPLDSFVVKEVDSVRQVTNIGDTVSITYFSVFFTSLNKSLTTPQFPNTATDTISTVLKIFKDHSTNIFEVSMNGDSTPENDQELLDTIEIAYVGDTLTMTTIQAGNFFSYPGGIGVGDTFSYLNGIGIIDGYHSVAQNSIGSTIGEFGTRTENKAQLISWNGNVFLPNEVKQIPASVIRATNQTAISPKVLFSTFSNCIFDLRGRKVVFQTNRSNGCYVCNHSSHIFMNNYFSDRER